jgi:hypothetical protein
MRTVEPFPRLSWWRLVLVVGTPLAVAVALVPIRAHMLASNVALVLVVVVVLAAVAGGRAGGALCALASAAAFDALFTRPYGSFVIHSRDDVETTVLLLAVGLAVGDLVVRTYRSRLHAVQKQLEVERMQRLAELAAGGEPPGRLIQAVRTELTQLLDLDACWFERPPFVATLPVLAHGRVRIDCDDGPAVAPRRLELPVWGDGRQLGRFVLDLRYETVGMLIPSDDRATAIALADRLGSLLVTGTA